jgi:hypothetical protein
VSGTSGTGVVASGVMWPDRRCALRWHTPTASTAVYDSPEDIEDIHGHAGKTKLVWMSAGKEFEDKGGADSLEAAQADLLVARGTVEALKKQAHDLGSMYDTEKCWRKDLQAELQKAQLENDRGQEERAEMEALCKRLQHKFGYMEDNWNAMSQEKYRAKVEGWRLAAGLQKAQLEKEALKADLAEAEKVAQLHQRIFDNTTLLARGFEVGWSEAAQAFKVGHRVAPSPRGPKKYRVKGNSATVVRAMPLEWATWNEMCDFLGPEFFNAGGRGVNPDCDSNRIGLSWPGSGHRPDAVEGDMVVRFEPLPACYKKYLFEAHYEEVVETPGAVG